MQRPSLPLLALALLVGSACEQAGGPGLDEENGSNPVLPGTGDPSDPSDPNDPDDPTDPDPDDPVVDPNDPTACGYDPGPSPIRRLTRGEYSRVARDLLGDATDPGAAFPPDEELFGFSNNADAMTVSQLLGENYQGAAEALAHNAAEDLEALTGCAAAAQDDACAEAFIASFGRRAFRRSLTTDEQTRLLTLFLDVSEEEAAFRAGIEAVVEATLQSPYFLWRVEVGEDDPSLLAGLKAVSDHEMATRLSFLLWGSTPDVELLAAADAGELSTPEQVAEQARRLLADPRAHDALRAFQHDWLSLGRMARTSKDEALYPGFTADVLPKLEEELHTFLLHETLEGGGTLDDLLLSRAAFVDDVTAAHYGISGSFGAEPTLVDLPEGERAGLLTRAGLMAMLGKANQSSPILRGVFVRDRLLCDPPPPPPDDVDPTPPEVDPDVSTRERFAQHTADPTCAACHELIDPIGFGFENYDAVGGWRTEEGNGVMIDASGELVGTIDVDGSFLGAVELSHGLAESQQVDLCYVTQWWRFANGRAESSADTCGLDWALFRFIDNGGSIEDLLVDVTQTPTFRFRWASGGQP